MADYIYLLQTRLTPAQQDALQHVRDLSKARGMTVFLVGGAVRDLSSGAPIRDLDFAIQGNATKLKKDLQHVGALIGENEAAQSLFFNFPGGVRVEISSTQSVTYSKPGKPVYKPATILDDLRRRDFTANAMAISLNEGSYGLLMDPLNGIADLENRELRLVSNYGFIEDPSRMIRATRLAARTGWTLEQKTQQRYETGKSEDYIAALAPFQRAYELEEIFHEEDPLYILRRLEAEGWAKILSPSLSSAKANEAELDRLRDTVGQLDQMGIHPDPSAAIFPLLTAKLSAKESADLKASFARPGFADQIAALEPDTREFAARLVSVRVVEVAVQRSTGFGPLASAHHQAVRRAIPLRGLLQRLVSSPPEDPLPAHAGDEDHAGSDWIRRAYREPLLRHHGWQAGYPGGRTCLPVALLASRTAASCERPSPGSQARNQAEPLSRPQGGSR
jgi:tRNA nucleotidyltransferase (CCA-adding enzyme)